MRYHNTTKCDMLNGPGLRVVLWVAGCEHHCKNCQNPITWDINGGIPFDDKAKEEIFEELSKEHVTGITLSGGDPLHKANREEIGKLIDEIREKFPDKTIWLYTGYRYNFVKDLPLIKKIDALVDGPFIDCLKDEDFKWRGSINQKIYYLKDGKIIGKE